METKADWLRSEIEKLEGMKLSTSCREEHIGKMFLTEIGFNTALTTIITRYKEELKVLESK